ncbi:MAG: hypothetical protein HY647_02940 [Acidobacteria bacterium]|nr:hypothetical protein [Acidobacteriota bacterium]
MSEERSSHWKFSWIGLTAIGIALILHTQVFAQSETWVTKAPMPMPRCCLAVGVIDGILYAVGGVDSGTGAFTGKLEAYDPRTNAWATRAPMPTRRGGAAAAVVDGMLYVIGGHIAAGAVNALDTIEAYDPKTNTWSTKAPMPTPRTSPAAAVVDGIIYVVGGNFNAIYKDPSPTVEAYDPKTNTWSTKVPMPTPRYGPAAATVDRILYVVGGNSPINDYEKTVEAYDPTTNTWTTKASMPTGRSGAAAATLNGIVYAAGGTNRGGLPITWSLSTVEAYNPETNTWSSVPLMPTPRSDLVLGTIENTLYAVGGSRYFPGVSYVPQAVNEAFTPFLPVSIDIKPGEAANTINLKSNGTILVAILSSSSFGATTVDPATVTLAGAPVATLGKGTPMFSFADVNRDGRLDLLLHFRTQDLQLISTSTEAVLKGKTFSGQIIRGIDSIRLVP